MMKTILQLILLTLIGIQVKGQRSEPAINHLIDSTIAKYGIPSMVVGVVKLDTCYYGRGGVLRIGSDDRVNLKCKYHLGSNSKAITAFVGMKLIEADLLSLDSKMVDLIPELGKTMRSEYKEVTLADLLTHSAGVPSYTSDEEFEKLPELKGTTSEKRLQFAKFVLTETPVAKGKYSNAGFVIASLMLERASGKSFEQLLQETFADLQLDYFIGFPDKQNHLYPSGHWEEDSQLIYLPTTHSYKLMDIMVAAGDIAMDIVDYSKFVQLHLNGAHGNCEYLSFNGYKNLLEYQEGYALGWGNVRTKDGQKVYAHNGSAGTFFCHTVILPEEELAVIVIINSAEESHEDGVQNIRNQIVNLIHDNKLRLPGLVQVKTGSENQ